MQGQAAVAFFRHSGTCASFWPSTSPPKIRGMTAGCRPRGRPAGNFCALQLCVHLKDLFAPQSAPGVGEDLCALLICVTDPASRPRTVHRACQRRPGRWLPALPQVSSGGSWTPEDAAPCSEGVGGTEKFLGVKGSTRSLPLRILCRSARGVLRRRWPLGCLELSLTCRDSKWRKVSFSDAVHRR